MAARKPKIITNIKDIEEISNITEDDISTTFMMEMFGEFDNTSRFNAYDEITIPVKSYGNNGKYNKQPFITTVGIYVFNKFFIEKDLFDIFKYINMEIDGKMLDDINRTTSYALLELNITVDQLKRFHKKVQKMMPFVSILSPSYSDKILTCTIHMNKMKDKLIKKYEKELDAGDNKVADMIEKELLDFAVQYLDGDPGMDIFISGARGSISNNFKNMFVMKGVVRNPDPNASQRYNVATSNYMDGIKPEEYSLFANSLAAGPFSRAKKTEIGGYLEKLFLYAYQHIKLDPEGSDCGTKRFITIKLTKKNINDWMYCYVIEKDKLVEITSVNKDKYIGKTVNMRFSALCESKTGCCNKCFGNLEYRRGDRNAGINTTIIPSTMKNRAMKFFHDSSQVLVEIDLNRAFGFKKK